MLRFLRVRATLGKCMQIWAECIRMFTGTAQNIALAAATIKFSSSCNTTRSHLQTKNRAHTAATLKYSSPGCTPDRTSKQRIMLPLRPHSNSHPRRYPRGPRGGAAILGCRTQILGVPVCEIRERELEVLESRGRNHKLFRILHGNTHNSHSRTPTKEV